MKKIGQIYRSKFVEDDKADPIVIIGFTMSGRIRFMWRGECKVWGEKSFDRMFPHFVGDT